MSKVSFDFVNNPEKTITPSTAKLYKQKLNSLTKNFLQEDGKSKIKNKEDILNHAKDVADFVKGLSSKQMRSLMLGAIFYAIGRQDFDKDPRGKPLFEAFQENYKK